MSGKREDILASAVRFLQDPKVQASSLGKKVAFLESKGLTSEEIEEAMARANGTGTAAAAPASAVPQQALVPTQGAVMMTPQGQQVMMAPPPLPPKYDWKDMFIAAVVAGGFGYGVWQVAKKVLGPKLQWPSQEDLDLDKKKLDEQFDEIEKQLSEVKDSTTTVAKNVEEQTAHVKESLESLTGVLDGMKTNDDKREQELAGLKTDIENIKTLIPKLMEKNKESQASVLNELQTEIKSLKSLLLNRRVPSPMTPTATPGAPGTPTWNSYSAAASSGGSQPSKPEDAASASSSSPSGHSFMNTKASIPAWQLASQKPVASPVAAATSDASEGSSSENKDATA